MEAAAGVNLASIWLGSRSEALDTGCTPAHRAAGECMSAAALAMKEAARSLHDAGARLESASWVLERDPIAVGSGEVT